MIDFLCIGINKFALPGNGLQECVADAQTMHDVGLALGAHAIDHLWDSQATKANAIARLTQLIERAKSGLINYAGFSWSGHGTDDAIGDDGLQEALICADIAVKNGRWDPHTIITAKEFQDLLNQVPETCRVEVWLDVCFSFGLTRKLCQTPKAIHGPDNVDGRMRMANSQMHHKLNSNIVVWCACSQAQESADAPNLGNGAGTYSWVKAWKENPQASRIDVIVAQRALIKSLGFDQVPRLSAWNAAAQGVVGD
jgi:hypothetical protein